MNNDLTDREVEELLKDIENHKDQGLIKQFNKTIRDLNIIKRFEKNQKF